MGRNLNATVAGTEGMSGLFRVEVKHTNGQTGGIFAYFATMQEALDWCATWKDAVWVHIHLETKRPPAD